jgi:hypothetical protein
MSERMSDVDQDLESLRAEAIEGSPDDDGKVADRTPRPLSVASDAGLDIVEDVEI